MNSEPVLETSTIESPTTPPSVSNPDVPDAIPTTRALWWLLFLLVLKLVAPFIPVNSDVAATILSTLFTVLYAIGVVQLIASATSWPLSKLQRVIWLIASLGVWYIADSVLEPMAAVALKNAGRVPSTGTLFMYTLADTIVDFGLLSAAVAGGSLVAQMISAPNVLAPLCAIFAMIDIWFVLFGGIASQIATQAPKYAAKVTAAAPAVGAATTSKYVVNAVGIGAADYLFIGLVFAVMHRYAMNWRGSALLMSILIGGALIAVNFTGLLPGLLFIGLGAALPNIKFFKFSGEERIALIVAGGFVLLLTIGLYFATPYLVERMKTVQ